MLRRLFLLFNESLILVVLGLARRVRFLLGNRCEVSNSSHDCLLEEKALFVNVVFVFLLGILLERELVLFRRHLRPLVVEARPLAVSLSVEPSTTVRLVHGAVTGRVKHLFFLLVRCHFVNCNFADFGCDFWPAFLLVLVVLANVLNEGFVFLSIDLSVGLVPSFHFDYLVIFFCTLPVSDST